MNCALSEHIITFNNFRQEREVAKKRKEMITPKSKDEVAFAELERALSSGISLKDEGALLLLAKFD